MIQANPMPAASEVRFNRFLASIYPVMAVGMAVTVALDNMAHPSK
jgi:hypothetical protein